MKRKSFKDIYKRNFKNVFFNGFITPNNEMGALVPIVHILLLPLTLTFGAGIKSLIDFFSRKELTEDSLNEVEGKILSLDKDNTTLLIQEISNNKYRTQSHSSNQLIDNLAHITLGIKAIEARYKEKKRQLQEEQLGIDKEPNLLTVYRDSYISNLTLDQTHQDALDSYSQENTKHYESLQLMQKTMVKEYLSAPHNAGKRMQHIICGFFSQAPKEQEKSNAVKPLRYQQG